MHKFETLKDNSPEHTKIIVDLINSARNASEKGKKRLAYKALPESVRNHVTETNFSRWLNVDDRKPLPPTAHEALVRYLFKEGFVDERVNRRDAVAAVPDYLFHALTMFLDIWPATQDDVAEHACGVYRLWRHSLHWRGQFLCGMLEIWRDGPADAIIARETQTFAGTDGSVPITKTFDGYLLRKQGRYILASKDDESHAPRLTMLNEPFLYRDGDQPRISTMDGAILFTNRGRIYCSKVYFERWHGPGEDLKQQLGLVPRDKVPESTLQKLSDISAGEFDVCF